VVASFDLIRIEERGGFGMIEMIWQFFLADLGDSGRLGDALKIEVLFIIFWFCGDDVGALI